MKITLLFISITLAVSCSSQNLGVKTIEYKGIFPEESKNPNRSYLLDVPKGGKLLKGDARITGDYHTEYRITYPDSSVLYITNNEWGGSRLNSNNLYAIGITGYSKKHLLDTLNNEGKQPDQKYWRECIMGDIVIGYVNVPFSKKGEYDKVLSTLRRKGK